MLPIPCPRSPGMRLLCSGMRIAGGRVLNPCQQLRFPDTCPEGLRAVRFNHSPLKLDKHQIPLNSAVPRKEGCALSASTRVARPAFPEPRLAGVAQGDGIWPPPRWMRCLQHASCPGCGSLRAEGSTVPAPLVWQSFVVGRRSRGGRRRQRE